MSNAVLKRKIDSRVSEIHASAIRVGMNTGARKRCSSPLCCGKILTGAKQYYLVPAADGARPIKACFCTISCAVAYRKNGGGKLFN